MADVVDEEGYQFLRELVGTIVVGAVGDNSGHSVSVVECTHEMVARSLGSTIRAVGLLFEVFSKE